jgi:hypothetical protein
MTADQTNQHFMALTLKLKGWKQILAGLTVLSGGLLAYSAWIQSGLKTMAEPLLVVRLKSDLQSEAAAHLGLGDPKNRPTWEQGRKFEEEHANIERLQIRSLDRRGWGGSVVARIKFSISRHGAEAEDIRYYRLKFNWLTGWYVYGKITEGSYQTGWL